MAGEFLLGETHAAALLALDLDKRGVVRLAGKGFAVTHPVTL